MKSLLKRTAKSVAPTSVVARWEKLRYVEVEVAPLAIPNTGPDTVASVLRTNAGIDMREDEQVARVKGWSANKELFEALREDPEINTWHRGENRLHNTYFPTPDAECYASLIKEERPARIVEIGGGFSTFVARKTIAAEGLDTELVVIDPQPRTAVEHAADLVVRSRVEEAGDDYFAGLPTNSIVFIDSSHITRIGGDIPHLFGIVLPSLPAGTLVHVHDVFLPYDYPSGANRYFWNEQYVLEALLSHSPRYEIVLATHFMSRQHPEIMQDIISPVVGSDSNHYGTSLWFRVR